MNTKEIQTLVAKRQVNKGHNPVCENLSKYFPNSEGDVVSVSSAGYVYEFEVKISRGDFKADCEKKKHLHIKNGSEKVANYFAYVCLPGLIKGHEVPGYAGLYYLHEGILREIIKPPLIHKGKHELLPLALKMSRVTIERLYLGACKLTVKNNSIKARNKNILAEAGFNPEEIKKFTKQKLRK
jgi:hypothetical protein